MHLAIEERPLREASSPGSPVEAQARENVKAPKELASIVARFASSDGWLNRVRLSVEDRWYERLHVGPDYDIWAISWMPGQSTGFHDHGESSGAFVVVSGVLEEHRPDLRPHAIPSGEPHAFGPEYTHDVRNSSCAPAISIHAYSPPLSEMNEYELDKGQLVRRKYESERVEKLGQDRRAQERDSGTTPEGTSIDQILTGARTRLRRLTPEDAYEAVASTGAVLVDIRPEGQRAMEGTIPGAVIVERNVLEWRFDPASTARLPVATNHDVQVIVFCSEGYTSSLAAASLQDLGLRRGTDIVGGFHAWRASGMPIVPPTKNSGTGLANE